MNKQRKVLITTTYNEMGVIIDTKAEEVAQPNLQPKCINSIPPVNPQEPRTGWIPVSERLPEYNGRYLVSLPSRLIHEEYNVMILNFAKSLYVPNKEAWYEVDSNMVLNEVPGVTAWMPLPEPYKESEE